jgi:hypothetical protein
MKTILPDLSNVENIDSEEVFLILFGKLFPNVPEEYITSGEVWRSRYSVSGVGKNVLQKKLNIDCEYFFPKYEKQDYYPSVLCICMTNGDHTNLEYSLGSFLDQDYVGEHKLVVGNYRKCVFENPEVDFNRKSLSIINASADRYYTDDVTPEAVFKYIIRNYTADLVVFWDVNSYYDREFLKNSVEGLKLHRKVATVPKTFKRIKNNRTYFAERGREAGLVAKKYYLNLADFKFTPESANTDLLQLIGESNTATLTVPSFVKNTALTFGGKLGRFKEITPKILTEKELIKDVYNQRKQLVERNMLYV